MIMFGALFAVAALASLQSCGVQAGKIPFRGVEDLSEMSNELKEIQHYSNRDYLKIVQFPQHSVRQEPGKRTVLVCGVYGSPSPNAFWLMNDVPVEEIDNADLEITTNEGIGHIVSKLVLDYVSSAPENLFTCVGTAGHSIARKSVTVYSGMDEISMDVETLNKRIMKTPSKPVITNFYATVLKYIGSTFVIPCRAVGNPRPKVEWFDSVGNSLAEAGGRFKVLESGDLLIQEFQYKDMDNYICIASNENGNDKQATFIYPMRVSERSFEKE